MYPPFFSAAHSGKIDTAVLVASQSAGLSKRHQRRRLQGTPRKQRDVGLTEGGVYASDDGETVIGSEEESDMPAVESEQRMARRGNGPKLTMTVEKDSPTTSMAASTGALPRHTWISLWFLLTVPVIAWDVSYCFMRPRSMKGGDLHWIWKPYSIYQEVDLVYGVKTYEDGAGFINAQSLLNVVETLLNILYLYCAHFIAWPPATLIGFAAAVMTLSKTVLYLSQEYYCNYCAVGHNTTRDLIVFYILTNGLWIVFPGLIVLQFGKDLVGALNFAATTSKKVSLDKTK